MFQIQLRIYRSASQKCLLWPLRPLKLNNRYNNSLLFLNRDFSKEFTNKAWDKETPRHKTRKYEVSHATTTYLDTETESEKQFLVQAKLNPDQFGSPQTDKKLLSFVDEGDIREEKHISEKPPAHKRLSTQEYADIIKSFIRQRKIKEAIDVVEVKMIQEDRVKPENYIYNLLLGACGRVGYTKKAFMLYNGMKKRGLKVTGGTYTALFNACANSPWPETDGLTRANHLYNIMIEKGDQPNDTVYNSMIKAFGRCGDLPMAFSLVDGMTQKGFRIKDDTINFLLQACISDKESGFRHSLLVWQKLIEKNINPSIYTFNLLLRCVRDCGLGNLEATNDVIKRLVHGNIKQENLSASNINQKTLSVSTVLQNHASKTASDRESILNKRLLEYSGCKVAPDKDQQEGDQKILINTLAEDNYKEHAEVIPQNYKESENNLCNIVTADVRPNLLAQRPHLGNTLLLSEVKKPEERLLLIGGCKGFLETMKHYKCTPDIKTFTQLLSCIPSTQAAEKELISAMKQLNVAVDIDFYNMLIKKKSMRCEYDEAKKVVISMKQEKIRPDLVTYGVLALGCKNREEANDLVSEIKGSRNILNAAILGAMLQQACFHMAFDYIFEIMELCLKESVPVNKKFLEHLDEFKESCRAKLDAKALNKKEVKLFGIFKARHKNWLTEVQIDETENAHPWQQYRQTYPEDVKTKPKDTARFKARHASLFKVKTSQKQRY